MPRQQFVDAGRGVAGKAAEDVGFYYAANAVGRFTGILLSGLLYGSGGLPACLAGATVMLACCWAVTLLLPSCQ